MATAQQKRSPKKKSWPFVSITIITKNVERTLPRVLSSIEKQDYPRSKIEVLIVDGGSTDRTHEILKRSKLPIRIIQSKFPDDPEASRGYGLPFAKGEIISFVDSDNYLPDSLWLQKMMRPFMEYPEIVGTETQRFAYVKSDNYLNRYFALIGSADPVGLYLGKADKMSYIDSRWNLWGKVIAKEKDYFIIEYDPYHFPTLGSNAFCARIKLLKKAQSDPLHYFHIDVPLDLAHMGYLRYAMVNETIIHDTAATPSIIRYVMKRANYMKLHYQKRAQDRRYMVFDPRRTEDLFRITYFVICSLTFVQPFYISCKGFLKKRDWAWFIHPLFCFAIMIAYISAIISRFLNQLGNRIETAKV